MDALGYYNGKWGPLDEMFVPMNDRGCYFGDGVYDAASAANGVIFTLDEHVQRFFNSAELLEIKLDYTQEELKKILNEMLARWTRENTLFIGRLRGELPAESMRFQGINPIYGLP